VASRRQLCGRRYQAQFAYPLPSLLRFGKGSGVGRVGV
jgi:hypothetical protein